MTVWQKFTYEPSKEIYDVRLDTGHVVKRLQRSAKGTFCGVNGLEIKPQYVREIRIHDESNKD